MTLKVNWNALGSLLVPLLALLWQMPASGESRFRQLTMANGLSNARVFGVLQGQRGYMWLATEDGLDRYNGYTIRAFKNDPADASSISSNLVRVVYEDHKHRLWIGTTEGGLNLYDPSSNSFRHFIHAAGDTKSLASNNIVSINETRNGKLLIGTLDAGLDIFDPDTGYVQHYPAHRGSRGPGDNQISAIVRKGVDTDWIATRSGLDLFYENSGQFAHLATPGGGTEIVRGLAVGKDGRVWIASDKGLQYIANNSLRIESVTTGPAAVRHGNLSSVLVDSHGNVWVGSVESGLYLKRPAAADFTHFHQQIGDLTSLSSDALWDIYEDNSGLIWITTDNGVDVLDPRMEDTVFISPLLAHGAGPHATSHVGAIFANGNALWLSSTAGLYSASLSDLKTKGSSAMRFLSPIDPNTYRIVTYLTRLDRNTVLAATATGWILALDNSGRIFRRWKIGADIGLMHPLIFGMAIYTPQTLFLATYGDGLLEYDLKQQKTSQVGANSSSSALPANAKLLEFVKMHDGLLAVATTDGLYFVNAGSHATFRVSISGKPKDEEPISLYYHQGHLWVGTIIGLWDLSLDSDGTIKHRRYYPLDRNSVSGIEPDRAGHLWLAGDTSVIRLSPATGKLLFVGNDQNLPVSGFYDYAHTHTSNGWLWFGGPDGLIGLDPVDITPNATPPKVSISNITIDRSGKSLLIRQRGSTPLVFNYDDSLVTFNLAVLDYGYPDANTFSYRLVGAQSNWTPPSTAHQIVFPSLEPGKYQLEVKGANNWGVWSKTPAILDFSVTPPWWRTWWAYSLYTLLILGTMLLYVHGQQRKLKKEREISARLRDADAIKSNFVHELEAQVSKATADLKNSLESVNLKNQELEIANRRANEGEQIKSQFLANMSHELRTPLTAILGYLKLLQQTGASLEQTDYLRTVQRSAESLLAIINDTLDLSRIEAGKLLIDEVDFDLLDLIESTIELLGPSACAKRLRLVRIIPPEVPLQLRGDPLRIRQILTNLVGNAIKFTQSGSVCIRIQELERREKDVTLGIAVSDTGVGIPASAVKHLFEAYSRHEASSGSQVEGTGLGLSICKKLLDLMGGDIEVLSTPGVGSTFEFRLTFKLQKHPVSRPALAAHARIGLFDRHPLSYQAWQASLSRLGCEVIAIREIRALADHDIDALIAVPAIEEMDRIQESALEIGSMPIPRMILAPTAEAKTLDRVSEASRCRVRTTLIRESQLLSEIQTLIPAPVQSKSDLYRTATPPHDLGKKTDADNHQPLILVADDNAINRKLLTTILVQNHFRVLEAANGEELIALAARETWDAALVDIHMPDMDGIEATQKLLALKPGTPAPVIAVSADALPETRASAQAAGMVDYLVKPYSEEQLLAVLRRNLSI